MKSSTFKYSVLTVGIAAAFGMTNVANAAESIAASTPTIKNIASATYKIGTVAQTAVQSNPVTVNITQSAAFSLTATNEDGELKDDLNKAAIVTPKGRVAFNHILTNSGNVEDTYRLNLAQGGTIPGSTQDASSYDLDATNVTYIIYNADNSVKSTTTVTGSVFQNTDIKLKPNERAEILISAKTAGNVGGNSQNLTLSAVSEFFTGSDATKATLTNIDNSITKVAVFKITSKVSSTLNLNDPTSKVTYTVTVRNDETAPYAANANNIVVFDGLPEGLRLADQPNLSVSNNATIVPGREGKGTSTSNDSIRVTLLNLAPGETATITFDVQKDQAEPLADPKKIINHASITLNLGENQIIYDTTDSTDPKQNTSNFYPAADDSEVTDGTVSTTTGSDSAAPLVSNQRAINISSPTTKEIPTTTTDTTQITHSAVIRNTGRETEGDQVGEIKFTITEGANDQITRVPNTVEVVYDADDNPATPNLTYTVTRDGNGDYDLSTAVPKNGGAAWTGMAPNSSVTINYKVESTQAIIDSTEKTSVTLVAGGQDAPTVGARSVENTTVVKGLKLVKKQALNKTCNANASLVFTQGDVGAEPGDCIVYKITAFNNFSASDTRFNFTDLIVTDTTDRFNNKAEVLTSGTTPAFTVKLAEVADADASPADNTYGASANSTAVSGTVPSLAPQKYAALVFSVKINPDGAAPGSL
ncbi:DUF11 domain-containing protein [Psychrobacter sp. P2G3]|uniref:DUF11 domain-containing protein n=1 Tax=Psychrobacter sp. P2G3 TaxID=1699622 RepID=UPI00078C82C7|nr:DUF11 domain-containing protein [Psychrobacter sp. P2G3]AMN49838.1 hypothetical protein AK823_08115 [Psychrobacter sp. P2G3]